MRISNEGLLVILFVGLIAGWLAGKIVRGTGFGIIGDILVGIAGALVASFLFPKLGIHIGTGLVSEIIYSAIGAVLLFVVAYAAAGARWRAFLRLGRSLMVGVSSASGGQLAQTRLATGPGRPWFDCRPHRVNRRAFADWLMARAGAPQLRPATSRRRRLG